MDGITELACFLRKNRDLSIQNSPRLIECTLAPLLAFSGPVIIWPEKESKRLTAVFVRCNKEAWQMSPNTSTALFTFPKDQGGLQIKMPRAIICSAAYSHLTRCCQFDDGTRQPAEITYKDATPVPGYGGPPICGGIPNMGPGESELIYICMSLDQHNKNQGGLGPIQSGLDSISSKYRSSTGYDKHPTSNPHTI